MVIASFSLVALDSRDPVRLAGFYSVLLGWPLDPENEDGDWVQLRSPAGATLAFQLAPDHVAPPWPDGGSVQLHIDFNVPDLDAAEAQILALGAIKTETQPGLDSNDSWRVYVDPDGHPFCLVRES
jgi:predicted enzyme related to lactoylglutathione lyase